MDYTPFRKFDIESKIVNWKQLLDTELFEDKKLKKEYYLSPEESAYKIIDNWITDLMQLGADYEQIVDYDLFKCIQYYLEADEQEENYERIKEEFGFHIVLYRITGNMGLTNNANVLVLALESILTFEEYSELNGNELINLKDFEEMAKRYSKVRELLKSNPDSIAHELLKANLPSNHFALL